MLLIVWGYSNTGTGKSALTSLWTFFTSAETKRLFCFFASSSYIFHLFNSLIRLRARAMIQTCGEDDEDVGGIIKSLASLKPSGLKINRLWVWNININKNNIFRPFSQSLFVYIYSILCVFHILRRVRPRTSKGNTVSHGNIARYFQKTLKRLFYIIFFTFVKQNSCGM